MDFLNLISYGVSLQFSSIIISVNCSRENEKMIKIFIGISLQFCFETFIQIIEKDLTALAVIEWHTIYVNKIHLTNTFWILKINLNNNPSSTSLTTGACVINIKLLHMTLKWIKISDTYMVVMAKFSYVGIGTPSAWFS